MCLDPFNIEDFNLSDCYVSFHSWRFIKLFMYHFLFFFIFGPFISPLLILIENRNFVTNMGFCGLNITFAVQTIHWICYIVPFFLFWFMNDNNVLTLTEISLASLVFLLRAFIVAIRYATTTNSRVQLQYQRLFRPDENASEFMGSGWRDINPF